MSFSKTSLFRIDNRAWLMVCLVAAAAAASAQEFRVESFGGRYGLSFGDQRGSFTEGEGFVDLNLPWGWDLGSSWNLQTKLNASAGWLGGNSQESLVASIGPALSLRPARFPLSVEGGVSPTYLSDYIFGKWNFGTAFQFTSYIGVNLDFTKHLRLGYRFQHMSNAGLSANNPGLNMNMFALSYVF